MKIELQHTEGFTLVSHQLCPYVQRAVIILKEKSLLYQRIDIDLENKPDWFLSLSPLGKVPLLIVEGDQVLFESNAIIEYLNELGGENFHPLTPLKRAQHRAFMAFSSAILNAIAGLYNAVDKANYETQTYKLRQLFGLLEAELSLTRRTGNRSINNYWEQHFSLVDVVFGPVFRYFDVFEDIDFSHSKNSSVLGKIQQVFDGFDNVIVWRETLSTRDSIKYAVSQVYYQNLYCFLRQRKSFLGESLVEIEKQAVTSSPSLPTQ